MVSAFERFYLTGLRQRVLVLNVGDYWRHGKGFESFETFLRDRERRNCLHKLTLRPDFASSATA
jgi:hypothetical protein